MINREKEVSWPLPSWGQSYYLEEFLSQWRADSYRDIQNALAVFKKEGNR